MKGKQRMWRYIKTRLVLALVGFLVIPVVSYASPPLTQKERVACVNKRLYHMRAENLDAEAIAKACALPDNELQLLADMLRCERAGYCKR
jgi:hypothetical protein